MTHHSSVDSTTKILETIPDAHQILSKYFTPKSEDLSLWMNSTYERNMNHPEALVHKGISGNLLRSKSEAMIDMALSTNQIPFRYEQALKLGESTIYPDFTIRHPETDKIYYWEHFGMMDNPSYIKNATAKIQLYTSNGIIPSMNLIITSETSSHPLNAEDIKKTIEHYFG